MATRRRLLVLGALGLVAALGGCGAEPDRPPTAASSSSTSSPGRATPTLAALPDVTDITAAGGVALPVVAADWVQVVEGNVWTSLASDTLVRLDSSTGKEVARVRTKGPVCTAMDQGFGSLWLAECTTPASLVRVDPSSGTVVARIPLTGLEVVREGSVASGEGFVWVVTQGSQATLVKVDPETNTIVDRIPVEAGVVAARAGAGALWLTHPGDGVLTRRDVDTGAVEASIRTGSGARFFAVGEGSVWVQNNTDGTVARVDPAMNQVTATIRVDSGQVRGGDLAVGGGFVWARVSNSLVAKIDPATNTVVARYGPGAGSGSVAADDSAVWVSAHDVDLVYRLPLP